MGIYILYNHKTEYNYTCGRHGKGLYEKSRIVWKIRNTRENV